MNELLTMRAFDVLGIYQRLTSTEGIEPLIIFSTKIDLIPRILDIEFRLDAAQYDASKKRATPDR